MTAPLPDRWIELAGVDNLRETGGLPTRGGGHTAYRRLLRSDHLGDLTAASVTALLDYGVTEVVDLRSEAELALEGPGRLEGRATHHRLSLFRPRPVDESIHAALALPWKDADGPRDAAFWADHYLGYLRGRPESVAEALDVVSRSDGATLVHCAAGKDRTGTVIALALSVAGVPDDVIVADYLLTGERLARILDRLAARPAYAQALASQNLEEQVPRAQTMTAMLDALRDRHGGASGWLREKGWGAADVERLRTRLTS